PLDLIHWKAALWRPLALQAAQLTPSRVPSTVRKKAPRPELEMDCRRLSKTE
ncbi:hypothetical protein KXV92_007720, partial [Aspergillus fumigatus]